MRSLSYRWRLYGDGPYVALNAIRQLQNIEDEQYWLSCHRLTLLQDHADYFKWWIIGTRKIAKTINRQGAEWPQEQAYVVMGLHYGNGLYVLGTLADQGDHPAMLIRNPGNGKFPGRSTLTWYFRKRAKHGELLGRIVYTEKRGGYPGLLTSVEEKRPLSIMSDVAPDEKSGGIGVTILDRSARLRSGTFRFIVKQKLPVCFYRMDVDRATGMRTMCLTEPHIFETAQELAQAAADVIDAGLRKDSAAWMHAPSTPRFFAKEWESAA